jgi:hypothetical protein
LPQRATSKVHFEPSAQWKSFLVVSTCYVLLMVIDAASTNTPLLVHITVPLLKGLAL